MIGIVLVNWRGAADTMACVNSLIHGGNTGAFAVVVIDNHSPDNSLETLSCWLDVHLKRTPHPVAPPTPGPVDPHRTVGVWQLPAHHSAPEGEGCRAVHLVTADSNRGFGAGCNLGARIAIAAGCTQIWFLNNDCIAPAGAADAMAAALRSNPRRIFGTVLRYMHDPSRIQAVGGGRFSSITGAVCTTVDIACASRLDFINGASMAMTREVFLETGGFDDRIFMYFEENDLCLRASARGLTFGLVPIDVLHRHGGSQGGGGSVAAWANVLANKYVVLNRHLGFGPWQLIYWMSLLAWSVYPSSVKNRCVASRRVLRAALRGELKEFKQW